MMSGANVRLWLGLVLIYSCTSCFSFRTSSAQKLECKLEEDSKICRVQDPEAKPCDSYREYTTAYNYLLDKKDLTFTKDQASNLAFSVAGACSGAAGRFIRVFDVLTNAKVILPEATALALDLAQAEDENAETFVEVFKVGFLENYLDLSLPQAIQLARAVALDASGASALRKNEFEKLVKFCLSKDGLGLGKPECSKFAGQVIAFDSLSKTKKVGTVFIDFFDFLRFDKEGPQLATYEALTLAKDLMKVHVEAGQNFIPGYKFASDKKQLGLNRNQAITFAKQLAALSRTPKAPSADSKTDLKVDAGNQAPGLDVR